MNEHSLFLIDEPETFLHPPQAKFIGKCVIEMSKGKQCFIATHNIDFIKGVVEADSSKVKIIKINRSGNTNTFTVIDNESISAIATDRILKYTNILDGLFYGTLALCENEADCRFYAALLESLDPTKYQDTLFCAVGGKHQFKKVIPLLKKLDIQYRAIADIDLISSKDDLKQLLNAIEPGDHEGIELTHTGFLDVFQKETNAQVKTQKKLRDEINSIFNDDKFMSPENAKRVIELAKGVTSRFDLLKKPEEEVYPKVIAFPCLTKSAATLLIAIYSLSNPGKLNVSFPVWADTETRG